MVVREIYPHRLGGSQVSASLAVICKTKLKKRSAVRQATDFSDFVGDLQQQEKKEKSPARETAHFSSFSFDLIKKSLGTRKYLILPAPSLELMSNLKKGF